MIAQDFEKLVEESVAKLPEVSRNKISNVAFIVENDVRTRKYGERNIKMGQTLLGLYEGIPRSKRGEGYSFVLPDRITIFQKPIEEMCNGDPEKIKTLVYEVVWHEVGHHFGFDEDAIRRLEKKRFEKSSGK